jgi:hypothetical protein
MENANSLLVLKTPTKAWRESWDSLKLIWNKLDVKG